MTKTWARGQLEGWNNIFVILYNYGEFDVNLPDSFFEPPKPGRAW
jgi:hypothetical protein